MLYMAIGILTLAFIAIPIFRTFSNRNWKLIYSTIGNEEYFRIIAKLKSDGIKFKTETPYRGFDHRMDRFKDHTQYDIYVKKEEEHLAVKALQKGN
ncbi:hypothetical protein [Neobacillus jeddahensis]|uniref:hypothetical protein n=1 Tax=Neobacillus jeddahensis TaxID=1461580 RepID=UPI00059010B5|nr:hypothetical protein [Neobacillus jeddahensis]